jgi:hypothetical protein
VKAATVEEWHVESIGGDITGSYEEVRKWVRDWIDEHGDAYDITVRRRTITTTPWVDSTVGELNV